MNKSEFKAIPALNSDLFSDDANSRKWSLCWLFVLQLSDSLHLESLPQSFHYQLGLCSAVNEPEGVRQNFENFIDSCFLVDQVSSLNV